MGSADSSKGAGDESMLSPNKYILNNVTLVNMFRLPSADIADWRFTGCLEWSPQRSDRQPFELGGPPCDRH